MDNFVVRSVACGGCRNMMTGLAFITEVELGPIRCLLFSREFTSDDELGKVIRLFEGRSRGTGSIFLKL